MPGIYVVGIDGSEGSRTALRWAVSEAVGRGADVRAVLVWRPPLDPTGIVGSDVGVVRLAEQHRCTLDEMVDSVDQSGLTAPIERLTIRSDNIAHAMIDCAAGADLLVVGTRGTGGFVGLLLGSVAEHCVQQSVCPVVVVPLRQPADSTDVLVGVDGSNASIAALGWALERAEDLGGGVTALYAWTWHLQPRDGRFDVDFDDARAMAHIESAVSRAGLCTSRLRIDAVRGLPSRSLLERSADVGLLAVGAHGKATVRHLLTGSVARQLSAHSPCPLVVHR